MAQAQESIQTSVRIPFEQLIEKYGPYFWTSTIAYMIATAIDTMAPRAQAGEKVMIGLFGVDMSASEEFAYQRPGCQHFLGLAMSLGIEIVLPAESDLMRPPTMYGVGELNPRHIRLMAKRAECEAQRLQLVAQHDLIIKNTCSIQGMIAEIDYMLGAWSDDIEPDLRKAVSFSSEFVKPVGTLAEAVKEATKEPASTGADVIDMQEAKSN